MGTSYLCHGNELGSRENDLVTRGNELRMS